MLLMGSITDFYLYRCLFNVPMAYIGYCQSIPIFFVAGKGILGFRWITLHIFHCCRFDHSIDMGIEG